MADNPTSPPATNQAPPGALTPQQATQVMHLANQSARLYANGFIVALSASDIIVTFLINGAPSHVLNLPFATAKNLIGELTSALNDLEKVTGHKVDGMETIAEGLQKVRGSGAVHL